MYTDGILKLIKAVGTHTAKLAKKMKGKIPKGKTMFVHNVARYVSFSCCC